MAWRKGYTVDESMITEERLQLVKNVVAQRHSDIVVILEGVHDPHNIQAVIRSCDAFGIQQVCVVFAQQEQYDLAELGHSSSSSAKKWLDYTLFDTSAEALAHYSKQGYQHVVTALSDQAESLHQADLTTGKIALWFGTESTGISEEVFNAADTLLHIPMQGMVQSFNISVSAALCLYDITKQRIDNNTATRYTAQEQAAMVQDFINR